MRAQLLLAIAAATLIPTGCGDDQTQDGSATDDVADAPDVSDVSDVADVADSVVPNDSSAPAATRDTTAADSRVVEDTLPDEVSPMCADHPNPFAPTGSPGSWRHGVLTPLVLAAGDANHRGQDVIVKRGEPQRLVAKLAYGFIDKDLEDEDVGIWTQREPPCGPWELLGTARTSEDGQHGTVWGIEDDGGRVFFELPLDKRLPVGRYPIRMLVDGDHSLAEFDLLVVEPDTDAVVFDIDGTLTTGDEELITEIAYEIFNGTYDQQLRAGAVDVVKTWTDKGYLVVYLTGRPDFLRPMTERWVQDKGFPPGPLHLTDTNGQVLPSNSGVGTYKRDYLQHLMGPSVGLRFAAAYGNATTDIWAFEQAGIPKDRTFIVDKHGGEEGTVEVTAYPDHLPTAQAAPAAAVPAPAPHGWW